MTRFDVTIDGECFRDLPKRQALLRVVKRLCDQGVSPADLTDSTGRPFNAVWRCADGELDSGRMSAALEQQAREGGPGFDFGRWFMDDECLVHSGGKTWAFTKMWGIRSEDILNRWVSKFPNAGIQVTRTEE